MVSSGSKFMLPLNLLKVVYSLITPVCVPYFSNGNTLPISFLQETVISELCLWHTVLEDKKSSQLCIIFKWVFDRSRVFSYMEESSHLPLYTSIDLPLGLNSAQNGYYSKYVSYKVNSFLGRNTGYILLKLHL